MKRMALAVAIYTLAIVAPGLILIYFFGTEETIRSNSPIHLLALLCVFSAGFLVGTIASRLLSGSANLFGALGALEITLREERASKPWPWRTKRTATDNATS